MKCECSRVTKLKKKFKIVGKRPVRVAHSYIALTIQCKVWCAILTVWAEAVATAVYIMNRTPTSTVHGMTPEEKYNGKKPDLSHLKVFGCIAYVYVPDELRTKLDPIKKNCKMWTDKRIFIS
jgi:5'-3' exoribonuclease 2